MSNKFTDALENAEVGLDIIHEKLRAMQADAISTAKVVSAVIKTKGSGTPNGANKTLQETTMSISELNKKVNLYIGLQKDMEKQWKRNITSANQFNSNMTAINKQRERALKLMQQEKDKLEKNSRAYNKINKALRTMKETYRDLRVRKEMGMTLTEKEVKKMERLEKSILKVDTAMKTTDAKMGVHTRSVGNYGKAFDSLGFSVAQITRESPAFINSMQTGFMAISNNIPTLVDEIEKLKYKNADLIKNQKKAIPIWKSLGKAVFSYQTAISAAILLLTVLGPAMIKWIQKVTTTAKVTDGASASMRAFNETLREGSAAADTEIAQFEILNTALKSNQLTREQQLASAKKMKELYPELLKNMTEEEMITKGIGDNYDLITEQIAKAAAMKAVSNRMTEIATDKLSAQLELEKANADAIVIRSIMDSEYGQDWLTIQVRKLWLMGDEADAKNLSAKKQSELNKLDKEQERIGKFINKNISDYINLVTEAVEVEKKKEEASKDYALYTIAHYKDLISQNEKRITQQLTMSEADREEKKHLEDLNRYYQKQIDLLGGVEKKKRQEVIYLEGSIGYYEKLVAENNKLLKHAKNQEMHDKIVKENKELEMQIGIIKGLRDEWSLLSDVDSAKGMDDVGKMFSNARKSVIDNISNGTNISLDDIFEMSDGEEWDDYWNGFKPVFDDMQNSWGTLTKWLGKDISTLEADFEEMYIAMGGDPKDRKALEKAFGQFLASEEEKVVKLLGQITAVVNAAADLGTAIVEQNIEQLEQEKTAIEERFDLEMLKAQENFTTKEALQDKEIFLEKKKQKDLRAIQDKINKEKRKQALIDKAAAIATIAINTAIGVSAALTKGAVFNSAEVILTLALGALQVAAVLATPIPQYAMGTEDHAGGPAVVGDGGKHEAIITPDGKVMKSPNKDTLVNLPKGTVVKPDYDAYVNGVSEAQKQLYDTRLLTTIVMGAIQQEKDERLLNAIYEQTDVLRNKRMRTSLNVQKEDIGHQLWALKQTSW